MLLGSLLKTTDHQLAQRREWYDEDIWRQADV